MRPPGGYTPDMMNWANDIDVYKIYSDMVIYDNSDYYTNRPYHCVYCGRRDGKNYYYNNDALVAMFGSHIVMKNGCRIFYRGQWEIILIQHVLRRWKKLMILSIRYYRRRRDES